MSYKTISQCHDDPSFQRRINAAAAQEQGAKGELVAPELVIAPLLWAVASASDIESAYASALAAGNPDPGGDEAVITDGMILANVQAHWPTTP